MDLFKSGHFFTGCNYWASHAGMFMWRKWDGEVVRQDLAALSSHGMSVLRVFPLWPDFQPLKRLYGGGGRRMGLSCGEVLLSAEEERMGGVDPVMLERFRFLCDRASENGLSLIVGLLTGWMSGRLFVPPAFEERNILGDPEAVKWEVRFVRRFVREFRDHPAIGAWDLGNECNCMSRVSGESEAWEWMNTISSAIRLEDPSRPVVSGMHSISTDAWADWNMYDQGELLDVLTTHPYPLFTPECNREPFYTLRNELHSSCESLLYEGISGKPCFPEEAGSLGPMICSDDRAAASLRCALFSCWANHLHGFLWWCAFDQTRLSFAPYDWTAVERELGLFHEDRLAKETALVLKEFSAFLKEFPYSLPERKVDAVCLMPRRTRNCFPEALGSYLLAKQTGFELRFSGVEEKLPESEFYLLPSVGDLSWLSRHSWLSLLEKVREGATLMVSLDGCGMLSPFREVFGVRVDARWKEAHALQIHFKDSPERKIRFNVEYYSHLIPEGAEVLAEDSDGFPMMTVASYGKGRMILLNLPLEYLAATSSGCFYGKELNPAYLLYRKGAEIAGVRHAVFCKEPGVGVTEHWLDEKRMLAVLINYDPQPVECVPHLTGKLSKVWRGTFEGDRLRIEANDSAILLLTMEE